MDDATLQTFFTNEARWVKATAQRISTELDRKDAALDRLQEDPLLSALLCAVQFETEQREAEAARQELLREEETQALATTVKTDAKSQRRRQRQDDTAIGAGAAESDQAASVETTPQPSQQPSPPVSNRVNPQPSTTSPTATALWRVHVQPD